jgi:hypothetical protein
VWLSFPFPWGMTPRHWVNILWRDVVSRHKVWTKMSLYLVFSETHYNTHFIHESCRHWTVVLSHDRCLRFTVKRTCRVFSNKELYGFTPKQRGAWTFLWSQRVSAFFLIPVTMQFQSEIEQVHKLYSESKRWLSSTLKPSCGICHASLYYWYWLRSLQLTLAAVPCVRES